MLYKSRRRLARLGARQSRSPTLQEHLAELDARQSGPRGLAGSAQTPGASPARHRRLTASQARQHSTWHHMASMWPAHPRRPISYRFPQAVDRLLTLSTCLRLSPTASLTSPVRQLVRQTRLTGEHVTSKKTAAHVSNRPSRDGDTPPLRVLSDLLAEGKCSR